MRLYLNEILLVLDRVHPMPVMPVVMIWFKPVPPELVKRDISNMLATWTKLTRRSTFKRDIFGWYRRVFVQDAGDGMFQVGAWYIIDLTTVGDVVPLKPSEERLNALAEAFTRAGKLPEPPIVEGWCCTGHGDNLVNSVRSKTGGYPLIQDVLRGKSYEVIEMISDAIRHRSLMDSGGSFRKVVSFLLESMPF